jgi:hypothetical protein
MVREFFSRTLRKVQPLEPKTFQIRLISDASDSFLEDVISRVGPVFQIPEMKRGSTRYWLGFFVRSRGIM